MFEIKNAESVREFQPRVAFWQPWVMKYYVLFVATLKELRPPQPFQGLGNKLWYAKRRNRAEISEHFER